MKITTTLSVAAVASTVSSLVIPEISSFFSNINQDAAGLISQRRPVDVTLIQVNAEVSRNRAERCPCDLSIPNS